MVANGDLRLSAVEEHRLAGLVDEAYGSTSEAVELLRDTVLPHTIAFRIVIEHASFYPRYPR